MTALQTPALFLLFSMLVMRETCSQSPVVQTTSGPIQGVQSNDVDSYLGVPFAAPPERWRPPQTPAAWTETLLTTAAKPMCPQSPCINPPGACLTEISEDCLYLNIFAPVGAENLAVMVWFHGGSFSSYTAGAELYNGEIFVTGNDVILVTANYRLGSMGFLVHGTGDDAATGNYGLMDQRQALNWVHDNINAFGGNNAQVTIFGESAGGQSTAVHLVSGQVDDFFQQAIIQSSPFTIPYSTMAEAQTQGALFAELLGCSDMACLRQKSTTEIIQAQEATPADYASSFLKQFEAWGPTVDGIEVPSQLLDAFNSGNLPRKPIMLGTTQHEGTSYIYNLSPARMSFFEYFLFLSTLNSDVAGQVYSQYTPPIFGDARPTLARLVTDHVFACSTRKVARAMMASNVWLYVFDSDISIPEAWGDLQACYDKACHSVELPFLFQTIERGGFTFTDAEKIVSDSMIVYWTNFAKTGSPGGTSDFFEWPQYVNNGGDVYRNIRFAQPNSLQSNYRDADCEFWDNLGYNIV